MLGVVFIFQSDTALLGDLIALYEINLHRRIGGEWLALQNNASAYGQTRLKLCVVGL